MGNNYTLKYIKPITLKAGRRTIKACAVSRKHKHAPPSSTVTKYYEVLPNDGDDEDESDVSTHALSAR